MLRHPQLYYLGNEGVNSIFFWLIVARFWGASFNFASRVWCKDERVSSRKVFCTATKPFLFYTIIVGIHEEFEWLSICKVFNFDAHVMSNKYCIFQWISDVFQLEVLQGHGNGWRGQYYCWDNRLDCVFLVIHFCVCIFRPLFSSFQIVAILILPMVLFHRITRRLLWSLLVNPVWCELQVCYTCFMFSFHGIY